jgi:RHS repeat-associated protein
MTSVTFKNYAGAVTKRVSYLYDVFDRWVGETIAVPGQAIHQTRFIYDGDQIVLQFDKTGTGNLAKTDLSHRYLWGPAVDQLLADETVTSLWTNGSVVWPLADGQGTIRDLAVYNSGTDSTTIANHRVYNAYGVLESQTNAAADCLFGYTGRPFDKASGEQYNGARWYEAVTGRWLSEDPSQFASGDVRSPRIDGVWAGAG